MEVNNEMLTIISNETLSSVNNINIVTPSIYESVFNKYASSYDAKIEDENKLTNDILDDKISTFREMQIETSKQAMALSDNTNKAISAIKDKDENSLNEVLKETQDLRKEIEKLKEAVYKDELTATFNRKWLHDHYLKNSEILKLSGTLAIIDLNYFKLVNDTFGHIIGDKVLIYIANNLKKASPDVVRYGGDEFIIIFSAEIPKELALKKLNLIRESIISKKLKAGESKFKVSFSFGAYEFKEDDKLASIIELADKNMYEDKVQIKKRVTGI